MTAEVLPLHLILGFFNPLALRIIFLLNEQPLTRSQLYSKLRTTNNTLVKEQLDTWVELGIITGGNSKNDPYRFTPKGNLFNDWLSEGLTFVDKPQTL